MTLSAIICAHNPDLKRLERVFRALARQTLPLAEWECLLVDNASDPDVVRRIDMTWHPSGRLVREEALGLTPARLKGIAEARGEILVFVDDDCLLEPDYLSQAVRALNEHSFLGAVGGYGRAEYESAPPPWLNETFRWFHLDMPVPASEHPLLYARVNQMGPWTPVGAGMAIRKEWASGYAEFIRHDATALALDRTGNLLLGGGDIDIGIYLVEQGLAIGRSARLIFTHVVPAFRLEANYMIRLLYMSQYSVARLLVHRGWKPPAPPPSPSIRQKIKTLLKSARRYSVEEICWQAYAKGYADGICGAPPDDRFCKR